MSGVKRRSHTYRRGGFKGINGVRRGEVKRHTHTTEECQPPLKQPQESTGAKTKSWDEQERERGRHELGSGVEDGARIQSEEEMRTATHRAAPKEQKR